MTFNFFIRGVSVPFFAGQRGSLTFDAGKKFRFL